MGKVCDAVFEGGGVRGVGHVGAVLALEEAGYEFQTLVGTSAGAIVAGLLAVGYRAEEIFTELKQLDYTKFQQKSWTDYLGSLGGITSLLLYEGLYRTDYFETWYTGLLEKKGKLLFGDIGCGAAGACRLRVTASDLSAGRLLVLPRDLADFGFEIEAFPIAKAVRMSMSIPFFYEPLLLRDGAGGAHYICDGGLLSNYPMWLLDDGVSVPPRPVFGFKFISDGGAGDSPAEPAPMNLLQYSKMVLSTLLSAPDNRHISESKGDYQRSILIPTAIEEKGRRRSIRSTDFDLTTTQSLLLFQNGYAAAKQFLNTWDFTRWKAAYRGRQRLEMASKNF